MDECAWLALRQPFERLGGPRFVARQLLVLAHQPSDQGPVHATPDRLERRAMEMAIILMPSPQVGPSMAERSVRLLSFFSWIRHPRIVCRMALRASRLTAGEKFT